MTVEGAVLDPVRASAPATCPELVGVIEVPATPPAVVGDVGVPALGATPVVEGRTGGTELPTTVVWGTVEVVAGAVVRITTLVELAGVVVVSGAVVVVVRGSVVVVVVVEGTVVVVVVVVGWVVVVVGSVVVVVVGQTTMTPTPVVQGLTTPTAPPLEVGAQSNVRPRSINSMGPSLRALTWSSHSAEQGSRTPSTAYGRVGSDDGRGPARDSGANSGQHGIVKAAVELRSW